MQRSISFLSAIAVAIVTSLASGARADDPASALAPPPSAGSEPESHPRIELAAGFSPQIGVGGLGLAGGLFAPQVDVAVGLSDRVFAVLGGEFALWEESLSTVSLSVRAQIYLAEPTPGSVVPTIRAGVAGWWGALDDNSAIAGSVLASAGITWIASRSFGLRLEVGGAINAFEFDGGWRVSGELDASGAVVVRL